MFHSPKSAYVFPVFCLLLLLGIITIGCTGDSKQGPVDQNENIEEAGTDKSLSAFQQESDNLWSKPLAVESEGEARQGFEKVTDCGIDFTNHLERENHLKFIETGAGVAIADYDNDGFADVYLVSTDGPNQLYRGLPDFKFENVTAAAGSVDGSIDGKDVWGTGASFADVDNDGDQDLFVCNNSSFNILYINNGDGTFKDMTESSGLKHSAASKIGSFCDYDHDGDLDLYLLTNQDFEPEGDAKMRLIDGKPTVHPDFLGQFALIAGRIVHAGDADVLYRNDGDGQFTDVSKEAGIEGYDLGLSVTWLDYDHDGWKDIYVGNDFKTPDHLYRNNGDGTFSDVIGDVVQHTPWFSMGADSGDLNNDGLVDMMIADMSGTSHYKQKVNMGSMSDSGWFLVHGHPRQYMRNSLWANSGTGHFMDMAFQSDLDSTDWTWSIRFIDLDNDGLQDIFITNGHARNSNDSDLGNKLAELKETMSKEELAKFGFNIPPLKEDNLAFKNMGDFQFEEIGANWGLNLNGVSHAAGFADFDSDGDLDIVVNNLLTPTTVYRNLSNNGRRMLVELRGNDANCFGIGCKVEIWYGDDYQMKYLENVRGYLTSDEPVLHFGLSSSTVDRLAVTWPGGKVQAFDNLDTNRRYRVYESEFDQVSIARTDPAPTLFVESAQPMKLDFKHEEQYFDDYKREPLLPSQLSQLGPGVACGDINGDGYPDLYVGGAAMQEAAMFINKGGTHFERIGGPWLRDLRFEDMGSIFFDADGDSDLDLYVVSGSNEFELGDRFLQDRLYLNSGDGRFEKAPDDTLPDTTNSGSCVCAADFDRDGDLDLFVGSRCVPGRYPITPNSVLLRNDGGKFANVIDEVAPTLKEIGLVNSAIWSDFSGDGWVDLIVAPEWGPVAFFQNNNGQLEDVTQSLGIDNLTGWWHGISAADIDADGDMDYVVTNHGLNTKYHTDPEHPHRLYYFDFDDSGTLDLVESEFEGSTEYPVRGRSCSSHCMPFIADKFETYHDFALASLTDIYDEEVNERPHLSVTTLHSSVFLNDGRNGFRVQALPDLAQISPGYGVLCNDFDGDGHIDVLVGQNFFGAQPETGYMDGGLGLFLSGDGTGEFQPVWPNKSGVALRHDSTGMAMADFDGDGDSDVVVANNDHAIQYLRNDRKPTQNCINLSLSGSNTVGAKVVAQYEAGKQRVFEMVCGGSYLSCNSQTKLNIPQSNLKNLQVFWPDGSVENVQFEGRSQLNVVFAKE